jgi:hypothetical protein
MNKKEIKPQVFGDETQLTNFLGLSLKWAVKSTIWKNRTGKE